jgi:hypothetical protein
VDGAVRLLLDLPDEVEARALVDPDGPLVEGGDPQREPIGVELLAGERNSK